MRDQKVMRAGMRNKEFILSGLKHDFLNFRGPPAITCKSQILPLKVLNTIIRPSPMWLKSNNRQLTIIDSPTLQ